MSLKKLDKLVRMADLRYQAKFASIAGVMRAEGACRAQLERLDDLAEEARAQATQAGPMQLVGADALFLSRLDENRLRVNHDLSAVLARKQMVMENLRVEFGRSQAVSALREKAVSRRRATRAQRRQEACLDPWLRKR